MDRTTFSDLSHKFPLLNGERETFLRLARNRYPKVQIEYNTFVVLAVGGV